MGKSLLALAAIFILTSCGQAGRWMLQWYPRTDTDYGDLTPGFASLEMCRRAGAGKTIAALGGLANMATPNGPMKIPSDNPPWFECMKGCRPMREGSYLLQCDQIEEFKGEAAVTPH